MCEWPAARGRGGRTGEGTTSEMPRQRTSDGAEVWLQAEGIHASFMERTAMERGLERSLNSNSQTGSHAWWDAEPGKGIHLVTKPCCLVGSIWALELARPKFPLHVWLSLAKYPQVKWWKKTFFREHMWVINGKVSAPWNAPKKTLPFATFWKQWFFQLLGNKELEKETWCKDFLHRSLKTIDLCCSWLRGIWLS